MIFVRKSHKTVVTGGAHTLEKLYGQMPAANEDPLVQHQRPVEVYERVTASTFLDRLISGILYFACPASAIVLVLVT